MRILIILLLTCSLFSCQKQEPLAVCQLTKFVSDFPITKVTHYDNITLKDNRIEKVYSYDIKNVKDTSSRVRVVFEYNQNGKVSVIRDETNIQRIIRFEFEFDAKGNPIKSTQRQDNEIKDVLTIEYDSKNRPININSQRLLGLNRNIEYDANGNPYSIYRADFGNLPTIAEHTFDDKRNFFGGIPEIQYYWIVRPQSNFIPFGENNIVSSKYYSLQGVEFKEVPDLRTSRVNTYNEQGYPTSIKILLNNQTSDVSSNSSFEYNCK